VGRHVGRHPHGDARGTVDEQIRNLRGEDERFLEGPVEVVRPFDRILFDVEEELLREGERRASVYRIAAGMSPSTEPKLPCPSIRR
jgi:hypothetical protein